MIGSFSDQEVEGFLSHLRDAVDQAREGQLMFDITYDVPMPSPVQRKRIAQIIRSSSDLHLIAGHALVVNSPVGRGALTAINWIVRPKFAEKVFRNPPDAVAWLAARNPALDGPRLLSELSRAVPALDTLRW